MNDDDKKDDKRKGCVMKRIIAIRTGDIGYGEELAKKINARSDAVYHAVVFSNEEAYIDYDSENHVDILLLDEDLLYSSKYVPKAEYVCGLSEMSSAAEKSGVDVIFKYQSSEVIMNEIMKNYGRLKQGSEKLPKTGKTGFICVCSPVGGSYCSTFSLALATYLAVGQKVLFVSLDPFYELPGEIKNPDNSNFTDVIYYLDQGGENIIEHLSTLIGRIGSLEYISGASHWFDLYDFSPEHMHSLLSGISEAGIYDKVVFDVGMIGAASMELLLASEKIYTPVGNGSGSENKVKEWKRQIEFSGQIQLCDRIKEIRIPYDEILNGNYDYEHILHGRTGKLIEDLEAKNYSR